MGKRHNNPKTQAVHGGKEMNSQNRHRKQLAQMPANTERRDTMSKGIISLKSKGEASKPRPMGGANGKSADEATNKRLATKSDEPRARVCRAQPVA